MREIKFRAWDIKDKKMLLWNEWSDEIKDAIPYDESAGDEWTERCVVMQYTGRTTKSWKEIFDCDILGGDPHGTAAVRWNEEYCCFECFWYEESERPDGVMEQHECTALFGTELNNCFDSWDVIGNLFEHPELLQGYNKQNNAFLRL